MTRTGALERCLSHRCFNSIGSRVRKVTLSDRVGKVSNRVRVVTCLCVDRVRKVSDRVRKVTCVCVDRVRHTQVTFLTLSR